MARQKPERKERGLGSTLCADIQPINFSGERVRIEKKAGEAGLAAWRRWAKGEANGWCADGLCSKGSCQGFLQDISVKIEEETPEYALVTFSAKIVCACE